MVYDPVQQMIEDAFYEGEKIISNNPPVVEVPKPILEDIEQEASLLQHTIEEIKQQPINTTTVQQAPTQPISENIKNASALPPNEVAQIQQSITVIARPIRSQPAVLKQIYCDYFSLTESPFSITPDTRFYFSHDACKMALNTIKFAIQSGEGFIKVVGEVGTGKTLLCRKFLTEMEKDYVTAYVPNPQVEPMTLLMIIADELGIDYPTNGNQHQLLKSLNHYLIDAYAKHNRCVIVCLDEAHTMSVETLEMLRLLSNLETQQTKLLQLVLFGQPELNRRLEDASIRQLKQRISFSCRLKPLAMQEVEDYVCHRLNIAGYSGTRLFNNKALRLLYLDSLGIPRLVNILAHKALMAAYGEGRRKITQRHIKLATDDTEYAKAIRDNRRQRNRGKFVLGIATSATLTTILLAAWSYFL